MLGVHAVAKRSSSVKDGFRMDGSTGKHRLFSLAFVGDGVANPLNVSPLGDECGYPKSSDTSAEHVTCAASRATRGVGDDSERSILLVKLVVTVGR